MKKTIFITPAILLFASCKKDVKCKCTIDGVTNKYVVHNTTKRAAERGPCASYTHTDQYGNSTEVKCKLND